MRVATVVTAVVLVVTCAFTTARADDQTCSGSGHDGDAVIDCHEVTDGGGNQPGNSPSGQYISVWLPACPGATPTDPQAVEMACSVMLDCPDSAQIRLTLWQRQVADEGGKPVQGTWSVVTTECRDPGDAGDVRRNITWQDVVSAIRKVGVPTAEVSAPGYTLVNLDTTFYTDPAQFTRTLSIIGYTVDVEVTPATYTWHWGQGETTTTDTPGRPYPSTDVTHTFVRHTPKGQPLSVSVDVGWVARYRVDGGAWINIPETITVPGPATTIPVRQASAVLVEGR
jgi:hypothetical protein